jgi:hypothetical protein
VVVAAGIPLISSALLISASQNLSLLVLVAVVGMRSRRTPLLVVWEPRVARHRSELPLSRFMPVVAAVELVGLTRPRPLVELAD